MFQQWEYKTIEHEVLGEQFGSLMTNEDLVSFLNSIGADGWELVQLVNFTYIFKRPADWLLGG